jgi:hypothetical protein
VSTCKNVFVMVSAIAVLVCPCAMYQTVAEMSSDYFLEKSNNFTCLHGIVLKK